MADVAASNHRFGPRWAGIARLIVAGVVLSASCAHPPPPPPAAPEMFAKAKDLYDRGKWDKAKIELESFIFSHPGAAVVDSAQFLLGMCAYNQKDYIVAADEFQRLRTRYATSPLVETADLMRCRCLLRQAPRNPGLDQEQTQEAITQLRLFKDNHPLAREMAAADSLLREAYGRLSKRDYRAALLYHRMGRYEASRIYFQEMIDAYPESPLVPDALFYMGEGLRRSDSLDRAVEYYEKLLYLYPDHDRVPKAKKRVADLARRRGEVRASEQ